VLEARGLVKRYGALAAVNGVSLRVGPGEMVGLLGPNGAGKTTTVSMVAGLLEPDEGEVLIEGRRLQGDTDPLKRRIGLVPQEPAIVEELSARTSCSSPPAGRPRRAWSRASWPGTRWKR